MSILITGGTGFIGAEVARHLLHQGETSIHVMHRGGDLTRLEDLAEQLHFVEADLADTQRIAAVVADISPRVIYHLGAMVTGPGEANPQAAIQTNAFGTYSLLEAARLQNVEQFLFVSSIGSYGEDMQGAVTTDATVQRPMTVYGVTKVFGELLGAYYKRKYGLDFRCIRYGSIIGPGITTPSIAEFTSLVIEESSKGNPYTIVATPETVLPLMYYKDAARALVQLGQSPLENIRTISYLVNGVQPSPTMGELAAIVRAKIPGAQIDFVPNPETQPILDKLSRPLDDSRAQVEWGWAPTYALEPMVDDFLAEMES